MYSTIILACVVDVEEKVNVLQSELFITATKIDLFPFHHHGERLLLKNGGDDDDMH